VELNAETYVDVETGKSLSGIMPMLPFGSRVLQVGAH
jgi:hypothetical protein